MSRPTGAANQSPTGEDVPRRLIQTTPQMSPTHPHPVVHALQRDGSRDAPPNGPLSLPPLRQLSSTPPGYDRRPGGLLGMHSILNPQADLLEQQRNRRRSGSQMELPSPIENPPQTSLPSISRPTSVDSTKGEMMPARQFQQPRHPRRGPLSPTVHRTQSLSVLNPPTGTIDAHQSPFLSPSGRPTVGDSVTSQPALPTPPIGVGPRGTYFIPPTAPTPPPTMPASVASSQFETVSQQTHYVAAPGNAHMQEVQQIPMSMDLERSRIAMAPTSQSSIQIMTIKSQQGHHVQIPVDVQAASKVADEKRKRNAGASARFRARRKEKEREASMSIARLEQQLRYALEDRDFYRSERDYFQSVVYQQPGAERHYAKPASPRLRRSSVAPSNAASSTTGGGSAGSPYSAYDDDVLEPERNVRRRTSTYHPPPGETVPPLNGTGPSPANFSASTFASVNAPPNGMATNRTQQQTQIPFPNREQRLHQDHQRIPAQRPQLQDPFASESARHEQRNWAPAHG
ncbi:hypothetical protein N0V90_008435 [Kalmusia sp. IMI 367209]|nr:hypothetical protein N0V90_008435 [Kalmusia sp. IMI 367209]